MGNEGQERGGKYRRVWLITGMIRVGFRVRVRVRVRVRFKARVRVRVRVSMERGKMLTVAPPPLALSIRSFPPKMAWGRS